MEEDIQGIKEKLAYDPEFDLKPCPFCGNNTVVIIGHNRRDGIQFYCGSCNVLVTMPYNPSIMLGINHFNTRAYYLEVEDGGKQYSKNNLH